MLLTSSHQMLLIWWTICLTSSSGCRQTLFITATDGSLTDNLLTLPRPVLLTNATYGGLTSSLQFPDVASDLSLPDIATDQSPSQQSPDIAADQSATVVTYLRGTD
jgi:hypothetical protein